LSLQWAGSQVQVFSTSTGYCAKPTGKEGTFTIPAGETIYFWVQDSYYKDNSGEFEIILEY
jgi:hypothetical protein